MSHVPSFRPSAAHRWMVCGGSVVIDVPERPSGSFGDRGKFMHEVGERCLRSGRSAKAKGKLTAEDAEDVNAYVDFVRERKGLTFFETRTIFIPGQEGFVDCIVLDGDTLEIMDYKTGYVLVSPKENEQLIVYACGIVKKFSAAFEFKKVKLTIVQPCRENFDSWTRTIKQIKARGEEILARVDHIKAGDAEFDASDPEACQWCEAKTVCPALQAQAQAAARQDFGPMLGDGEEKLPEIVTKADLTLAEKLDLADLVVLWAKAINAEARRLLLSGESVPGLKVVDGKSTRAWSDRAKAKGFLEQWGFSETEIYVGDPTFVSPAQAEKLVKSKRGDTVGVRKKASERKAELTKLITKTPGAPTIAHVSDPRPAISTGDLARRDFADILDEGSEE